MTITGIASIPARRIVPRVAEMIIHLALQDPLDHHLRQLPQQAGRRRPTNVGAVDGDMTDVVELEAVEFRFSAAWCELALSLGADRRAFRATGLNDAFGQLAGAVAALARPGAEKCLQAVLWGDEPGGVFLDFASAVSDHLTLVVHTVAIRTWITAPDWTPVRGEAVLQHVASRRELAGAFLRGFEAVGAASGPGGAIASWPHPFPAAAVTGLRDALG